jgi:hypothetical protein
MRRTRVAVQLCRLRHADVLAFEERGDVAGVVASRSVYMRHVKTTTTSMYGDGYPWLRTSYLTNDSLRVTRARMMRLKRWSPTFLISCLVGSLYTDQDLGNGYIENGGDIDRCLWWRFHAFKGLVGWHEMPDSPKSEVENLTSEPSTAQMSNYDTIQSLR